MIMKNIKTTFPIFICIVTLLGLEPIPAVSTILPSDRTTSRFNVFSRMVPYLTALVPLAPVAHIPHIDAFAPGSTGNQRPEAFTSYVENKYMLIY